MPSINAGEAYIAIKVDLAPLQTGLKKATAEVKKFGNTLTSIMGVNYKSYMEGIAGSLRLVQQETKGVNALTKESISNLKSMGSAMSSLGKGAKFSGKNIQAFNSQLKQTGASLKANSAGIKSAGASLKSYGASIKSAGASLKTYSIRVKQSGADLKSYSNNVKVSLNNYSSSIKKIGAGLKSYGAGLRQAINGTKVLKASFTSAGKAASTFKSKITGLGVGLGNIRASIRQVGLDARIAGASLLRLGASVGLPIASSIKAFSDFQAQMTKVSTVLTDQDRHLLPQFADGVNRISKEFGKGTDEITKALFDILSAQVPVEDAMQVLEATTMLAAGGFASVDDAAQATITVFQQYSDSITSAADATDFLTETAEKGRTDIAQLAPQIGRVASLSKNAGLSLEEFGASLSSMTRGIGRTDVAITAARSLLTGFIKPSEQAKEQAKKLGFELSSTTLKTEGLVGILQKLQKATPEEIANIFPNARAIIGVLPLVAKMGDYMKDLEGQYNRTGKTARNFALYQQTSEYALKTTVTAAQELQRTIGGILEPTWISFLNIVKESIAWLKAFAEENQGIVRAIAIAVPIVVALGAALLTFGWIATGIGAILGLVSTAFAAVIVVIKLAIAAFLALFSPITLIVAGLAILVATAVEMAGGWKKVIEYLGKLFTGWYDRVKEVVNLIIGLLTSGKFSAAAEVLWAALNVAWQTGIGKLTDGYYDLYKSWVDIVYDLSSVWIDFTSGLEKAWRTSQDFISEGFLRLQGLFDSSLDVEAAINIIRSEGQTAKNEIEQDRQAVMDQLNQSRQNELNQLTDKQNEAGNALRDARAKLKTLMDDTTATLSDTLSFDGLSDIKTTGIEGMRNRIAGYNPPTLPEATTTERLGTVQMFGGSLAAENLGLASGKVEAEKQTDIQRNMLSALNIIAENTEDNYASVGE